MENIGARERKRATAAERRADGEREREREKVQGRRKPGVAPTVGRRAENNADGITRLAGRE